MTFFNFTKYPAIKPNVNLPSIDLKNGNGFLPRKSIIDIDSLSFIRLQELCNTLPKLLKEGKVVESIDSDDFQVDVTAILESDNDVLMLKTYSMLSSISHAYEIEAGKRLNGEPVLLPEKLVYSFLALSNVLGRVPTMTYETYILQNYRLIDNEAGFSLENIKPIITYTYITGEQHFIKIHVMAEFHGGAALQALQYAQDSISIDNISTLKGYLTTAMDNIVQMTETLKQMKSGLDGQIFFYDLRPSLKNYQSGIIFEGMGSEILKYRGASGAQSSVIPAIDRMLGLDIDQKDAMQDMPNYMPFEHREFIRNINSNIRDFTKNSKDKGLISAYNDVVKAVGEFRLSHYVDIIMPYIVENLSNIKAHSIADKKEYSSYDSCALDISFIKKQLTELFLTIKQYFVLNSQYFDTMEEILNGIRSDLSEDFSTDQCKYFGAVEHNKLIQEIQKEIELTKDVIACTNPDEHRSLMLELYDASIELSTKTFGTAGMDFGHVLKDNILTTESQMLPIYD